MPCQDAGACRVVLAVDGREVMLAVVSDGAGSAARSDEGSKLAVERFLEAFMPRVATDSSLQSIDRATVNDWLDSIRDEITTLASRDGLDAREFACTFLAAVAGPETTVCIQVGDGAIVASDDEVGAYSWLTWPQNGEYANTTNFLTDEDVFNTLVFEFIDRPVNEIAAFSDGIERLVLDMRARTVHSPALRPIFEWLASTPPSPEKIAPEPALQAFLGSARVNERTDDDKTLAMGTRASPLKHGAS